MFGWGTRSTRAPDKRKKPLPFFKNELNAQGYRVNFKKKRASLEKNECSAPNSEEVSLFKKNPLSKIFTFIYKFKDFFFSKKKITKTVDH